MNKTNKAIRKIMGVAAVFLVMSLLAACTIPLPSPPNGGPTAVPIEATTQPIPETAPPDASASFGGVSFSFDPAIAAGSTGEALPDTGNQEGPPDVTQTVTRTAFTFEGYTVPEPMFPPFVYLYRTADFAGRLEEQASQALAGLLAQRPDLAQEQQLPFLPYVNAAQALHAREEYIDSGSVAGIRYLTVFAQGPMPLTSNVIWYTFQGLANDGQNYVSAVFPLSTDLFPAQVPADFDYDKWFEGFQDYMKNSSATLTAAPADRFTPNLNALDALVRSIVVSPDAAAVPATPEQQKQAEAGAAPPAPVQITGTYSATLSAAGTPGLIVELALDAGGAASMTSDYQDGQPPIVETGTWQQNADGTVTTTFTQVDGRTLATPDVLRFAPQNGALVAVEFDQAVFGPEGLTLLPPGQSAAALAPTPLPAVVEPIAAPPVTATVAAPPDQVVGPTWQLHEVRASGGRTTQVADPARYTLTLNADGTASAVADCNTGKGTYTLNGDRIRLKMGFTRQVCPQPSLSSQYGKYLDLADTASLQDGSLLLGYGNSSGAMIFQAGQ